MNNFRVYLRAFEPDDYKRTVKWRNDAEIWNMLVGRRYFVSSEIEKQWISNAIQANRNNVKLAVCLKEDNEHIGNVYLTDIDWHNRNACLGKIIGEKESWGKGYGTEMTFLMLHHGFFDLGLQRIEARQLIKNKRSIRVNEKCGFKTEGILRKAVFKNGDYRDLNVMGILKKEFECVLKEKGFNLRGNL